MTKVEIIKDYGWARQWLINNVGPELHSQPIIFWHGEGWHMKRTRNTRKVKPPFDQNGYWVVNIVYEIEFDDDQMATLFSLMKD